MKDRGGAVRYAVVGLGWIAQEAVLPAFRNARSNSRLVGLVSGNERKRRDLAELHGAPAAVGYDGYDDLLESGVVDAVYIALPNHLHRDYAVRAAERGVHVLCEKPMAVTSDDCRTMIDAARAHDVRLMVAYRLHFEAANLRAVQRVRSGELGEPRLIASLNLQDVNPGDVRLRRDAGGGTLLDIGIYCINAARYLFGAEPESGWATAASRDDDRFDEVAEMTSAVLRFPGERLATFSCSFGSASVSRFQVVGTEAELSVEPAYAFRGERRHSLTRAGETSTETFQDRDQFGPLLLHFSDCVGKGHEPEPDGEEGLIDALIIEGLQHSIESGEWVDLSHLPRRERRPEATQAIDCPPVATRELVSASDPRE